MNEITMDLDGWTVTMAWPDGVTHGGPQKLMIEPTHPDRPVAGGITQTLLRDVDVQQALVSLRRRLEAANRWQAQEQASADMMNRLLASYASDRKITDTYLALLSRAYVAAVNDGIAHPLEHLAQLTGKTPAGIKNNLWLATKRGFLERSPGRAGGRVTGKSANVLRGLSH